MLIQVKIQPDSLKLGQEILDIMYSDGHHHQILHSVVMDHLLLIQEQEKYWADIMLEWTYITNRIYQDNLFNEINNNFF